MRSMFTPARAGRTQSSPTRATFGAVHPRTRGEDASCPKTRAGRSGSPPHARGRRVGGSHPVQGVRFTPARAGKTQDHGGGCRAHRVHPRTRGEDFDGAFNGDCVAGSPPHARGRRGSKPAETGVDGFTPARAGKTAASLVRAARAAVHPRTRGEDGSAALMRSSVSGSPPHARGRPALAHRHAAHARFTPARAGKTSLRSGRSV